MHTPASDQPLRKLTFNEVMELCAELARKLKAKTDIRKLVGVPRNGMILAGLIAHCDPDFKAQLYWDECIVIDDIHDSGETLEPFKEDFTATLFYRQKPIEATPTVWVETIADNTWVVFPWEK